MNWQGIPAEDLAMVPAVLQPVVKRALARSPPSASRLRVRWRWRWPKPVPPASSMEVGDWVEQRAHQILADRAPRAVRRRAADMTSDVRPAFAFGFPQAGADETRTALSSAHLGIPTVPAPASRKRFAALAFAALLLVAVGAWGLLRRPPAQRAGRGCCGAHRVASSRGGAAARWQLRVRRLSRRPR